jgi:dynein heavy chain
MVRNDAKEIGISDGNIAAQFNFFVSRIKARLHIVLAFSPIGGAMRDRIRNFPSLVNCCTIDWFTDWPKDALLTVAQRFLEDVSITDDIRSKCVSICQFFHSNTVEQSVNFKLELKRNYYVTPTSYLELITTFKTLLAEKRLELETAISR